MCLFMQRCIRLKQKEEINFYWNEYPSSSSGEFISDLIGSRESYNFGIGIRYDICGVWYEYAGVYPSTHDDRHSFVVSTGGIFQLFILIFSNIQFCLWEPERRRGMENYNNNNNIN